MPMRARGHRRAMLKRLPDYYVLLRVPPGASAEDIRASFRRLMVGMKLHPDLGGDHDVAARLNEAYAVLGDARKRMTYDRARAAQRAGAAPAGAGSAAAGSTSVGSAANRDGSGLGAGLVKRYPAGSRADRGARASCPFCDVEVRAESTLPARCPRCRSPLTPPPAPGAAGREQLGRRASARVVKTHVASIQPKGESRSIPVEMRDLSLTGMSFYSESALEVGQLFRVRDGDLEGVAAVVSRSRRGEQHSIHARLLTVAFQRTGVFVSATS